jgi:hypothetical protein
LVPCFGFYPQGRQGTSTQLNKKSDMKNKLFILLASVVAMLLSSCATQKKLNADTAQFRYEIECAGNGAQGTYMVKVWTYTKVPRAAVNQCKKNAVHGVIFKGFSGTNGCVPQRALVADPGVEIEYKDYFKLFFDDANGEYMKYVTLTSAPHEVVKVGREYKVGVIVTVQKDALRKALERVGVIKSLDYGF